MSKVTIVSPKIYIKEVINSLYALGVLHIQDYTPKEGISIGTPLKDAEKISELILDLHNIKSQISTGGKTEKKENVSTKEAEGYLKSLKSRISALVSEMGSIHEGVKALEKEKEELGFLSSAGISSLDALKGYENFELSFGYTSNPEALKKPDVEVFYSKKTGKIYPVAVLYKKNRKLPIDEIKLGIRGEGPVSSRLAEVTDRIEKLDSRKSGIEKELEKIARDESGKLNYIESMLLEKITKSEAPLKFASSDYAFLASGWVPVKNGQKLLERLSEISANIFAKLEEAGEEEEVPTKMDNPNPVRPFEFFLGLYSLPKYNEIEPSFLVFLTFPFFFGFMLGDIGYGLIVLVLGLALRAKKKHALVDIIIAASFFTILFGFVFGEAFGEEHIFSVELHPYLHRLKSTSELIAASAIIGLVHINMGFIMGFLNERRHHGFRRAFMGKISWIGVQAAGILFLLNSMGIVSVDMTAVLALGVLSLLSIVKSEGMFGIIELPSLVSNILSYFRLAAIGLASAALAVVVNDLAGTAFQQGGFMTAVGVLVLVMGHAINLGLGILGPFLQSMRLHYVEMFPKFYKGSGKSYEPFGK